MYNANIQICNTFVKYTTYFATFNRWISPHDRGGNPRNHQNRQKYDRVDRNIVIKQTKFCIFKTKTDHRLLKKCKN